MQEWGYIPPHLPAPFPLSDPPETMVVDCKLLQNSSHADSAGKTEGRAGVVVFLGRLSGNGKAAVLKIPGRKGFVTKEVCFDTYVKTVILKSSLHSTDHDRCGSSICMAGYFFQWYWRGECAELVCVCVRFEVSELFENSSLRGVF